jgi:hypothetical protein
MQAPVVRGAMGLGPGSVSFILASQVTSSPRWSYGLDMVECVPQSFI